MRAEVQSLLKMCTDESKNHCVWYALQNDGFSHGLFIDYAVDLLYITPIFSLISFPLFLFPLIRYSHIDTFIVHI